MSCTFGFASHGKDGKGRAESRRASSNRAFTNATASGRNEAFG